jgi:hypothetical protein
MPIPLLALLAGAGAAGKIFGGLSKGSADQRMAENNQASDKNRLLAQLYGINQGATQNALGNQSAEQIAHAGIDMDRRKFALSAPSVRAGQSVRGSIMQNAQPVKLSGLPDRVASRIPTIEGGLSPAMFSADTRALGGELSRKALIDQLKGDEFSPLQTTDFKSGVLPLPKLEEYQKAGLLEKILGGLGIAGSVAGGAGEIWGGMQKKRSYEPGDEWGWG